MRKRTIKLIGLMLIVGMLASMATTSFAAKKSAKKKAPASYSVKVPANILNGSDVTANRNFKVLGYKETTLAGIKLGDSNKKVLQKYGNPSRVIVHQEPAQQTTMGAGAGMPGATGMQGAGAMGMNGMGANMPGATGMGGMTGMPGATGMNGMPGMGGTGMPGMTGNGMNPQMGNQMSNPMGGMNNQPMMGNNMGATPNLSTPSAIAAPATSARAGMTPTMGATPGMPGATGMPGMPGAAGTGMPGMPGMGGATPAATTPDFMGTSERISSSSICWQYDLSSGVQLEFIIKNDKVSQITVLSLYPWKLATLKCGLMIGDTYKLVTYLWGVNYKHQQIGSFSRCTYWEKKGTALIFLNKKLVGMTVAAGDPII